jgi:hypothetical protein|tara:strand:- start:7706 stop:8254 length:549 start_codon:yes stop_codon:yes gene_type:complete
MAVRKTAKGMALKRWFKEKWTTPRGKKGYSGSDRTFRPTVRVSKDTPSTWSELSPSEKARAAKEKKQKGRVSRYKKKKKAMEGMKVMKKGGRTQTMPKMKMGVHKSRKGGLTAAGVAAYRRANPGSKLKTAVTTKPSKLKAGSKAAKRRKSFCARMSGMKGPMKKPNGKPTRKALALRKWNC